MGSEREREDYSSSSECSDLNRIREMSEMRGWTRVTREIGGCAKRPILVTHPKLPQKMKNVQKVEKIISDSSQEGHLLIWGHFPAKNGCQSLKF